MMDEQGEQKHIIQIQTAPPGWFAVFGTFGYMEKNDQFSVEGCSGVPIAGWAICEDSHTGERRITPFFGSGELLDPQSQKNFECVVFRQDWLTMRLNGTETASENDLLENIKNHLKIEHRAFNPPS